MDAGTDASTSPPPVKQNLRDRQRALTRQALLDGARAAFGERGYVAVTIEDIATRAGASRGTFYLHFTKAEAIRELLQGEFNGTGVEFTNLAHVDLASVSAVRRWLESYASVWRDNRQLARAWMEGDATDPDLGAMTDRRIQRTVAVLAGRITAQTPGVGVAEARARAALMDIQLNYFCYHVLGRSLDVEWAAGLDAMASLWWHGLTDPPVSTGA